MESKSDYHMQHTFPGIAQEAEKLPEVADLEANSIVCGDARVVLRKVATDSIRLIITSPPYWDLVDYGVRDQIGQCSYD